MATFESNGRTKKTGEIGLCGIFLILVTNCQFVATSVTWTAPPPAWNQSDSSVIRTVDIQVLLGSTQVPLRWNYNISSGPVLSTTFYIDESASDDIGAIYPSGITINDRHDYQTRFAISTSEVATLIINKVTKREEATYQCKLSVQGNTWAYNIRVNPRVQPEMTTDPDPNPVLDVGQNFILRCNASGDPPPNITWTKDGIPANQFNVSGYLLHLVNVQRKDVGSYRCTASNGYGSDATSVSIVGIRCDDGQLIKFGLTILSERWVSALSNKSSVESKKLTAAVLSAIFAMYAKNPGKQVCFGTVERFSFIFGSVMATLEMKFGKSVSDPLKPLQDEIQDGKLRSFIVKLDVNTTPPPPTTSPRETTSSGNFLSGLTSVQLVIGIIALVLLIAVFSYFIGKFCCKGKKKSTSGYASNAEVQCTEELKRFELDS